MLVDISINDAYGSEYALCYRNKVMRFKRFFAYSHNHTTDFRLILAPPMGFLFTVAAFVFVL